MRNPTVDLNEIARHAMVKYGFEPGFPKQVMMEVNAIIERVFPGDKEGDHDLRSLLWSSIDNIDSMDLDQLEYCEGDSSGEIHVRVAIADVDLYVLDKSQADYHAAHNGTSVYTGVVTFPMLPDRLSKGITSLLPGMDRMAVIIEYTVFLDGSVTHGNIYRAIVRNKAKLIYEEVGDWLEGTGRIPAVIRDVAGLEEQIFLQAEVMKRLKGYRAKQGALDLDTLEPEAVVEKGDVKDIIIQRQNMARCLIEEFMVGANGAMVSFLAGAGLPMIQRVVRVPKNWDGIVETARQYGENLPVLPDAKALSLFLNKRRSADPERFPDLSLTIVKLLGPGEYMSLEPGETPLGHFALAVTDYTHSTAPNRRYVDIINQRLLKSVLNGESAPYSTKELVDLSAWLTDREKASKKVERFMRKAAAAVLLRDRTGDNFEGIITGAKDNGTYVRLISPPAEGRVIRGEAGLVVGQKVVVRLIKTDPFNGFLDFAFTSMINEQKMK